MTPTITAFERSPDRGKGLARDMRVRWALEEAGQPYDVRLVSFSAMKEPAHRALNPFGQIPTYEDGDLVLFESGAIVFHIAERDAGLLPREATPRARAIAWMFAALDTVEPPIFDRALAMILERDEPWHERRLRRLEDGIRTRLGDLSGRLGDADWLDGAFSAGDLLMVTVLRRLHGSGLLSIRSRCIRLINRAIAVASLTQPMKAWRKRDWLLPRRTAIRLSPSSRLNGTRPACSRPRFPFARRRASNSWPRREAPRCRNDGLSIIDLAARPSRFSVRLFPRAPIRR
jgi:glutathione S-transferase